MPLLPIIELELRVPLRKRQPARRRLRVAVLGVGGTLLFLWLAAVWDHPHTGRTLHHLLCLARSVPWPVQRL